ncbi:MAG: trimeric intracellular cation channel family protein [Ferruginibacter sp.]|nr:trimeric intracellular cation channel family protein [Ferruginibacter sp.]MBU9935619.1 trimeric intracellular cation channel family protein [Ferruginibacter sp.]
MISYYFNLFGVLMFAMSGALAALDKNMYKDLFGISFTGFATAVGGGTLRDIILGAHPIAWVADNNYLIAITAGIILMIIFRKQLHRIPKILLVFDSIGIAIYTIIGMEKALALDVAPLAAVVMGLFTAVMGGVIRDTLINEIPQIFRKEIYATACIAGALVYLLLKYSSLPEIWSAVISIVTIIAIRLAAVKFRWSLPKLDI